MALLQAVLVIVSLSRVIGHEDTFEIDLSAVYETNSTSESYVLVAPNEAHRDELDTVADVTVESPRNGTNMSHLRTFTVPIDWDEPRPKLNFPKTTTDDRYKMASLHLDKGWFVFDFLRSFLSIIQPYDIPIDLLTDTIETRITTTKLITESMHVEAVFLGLVCVCCILIFVIPGTELWLACRPIRDDYKPTRHPGLLSFLLGIFVFILGSCMITMIVCNEFVSAGISKIPTAMETAIEDFRDFHSGTTQQVRRCLTRSLDVATEAILADIDNVEDMLGKPVQSELATETGLDVALDALLDLANASQELSMRAAALLNQAEKTRNLGSNLKAEIEDLRLSEERVLRVCTGQDRPLCTIIDSTDLEMTFRIDRLQRDDRLSRLRDSNRENLTEACRQARGEYLFVPQHIARSTLDARNQIRREINRARARIVDEARGIEASSTEVARQLETAKRLTDAALPYVTEFEYIRWYVGLGTILCIIPLWFFLFGALCCRCGSSEDSIRPTLLCGVFTSCLISIAVWAVFILALAISSHTEMLVCRPLYDPNYRTMEAVLESRVFLGKRLSAPLKDLFEKCEENEPAYPAFGLGNTMKLDQLTAHWTWSSLTRAMSKLTVDLKGLKIFTPNLQQRLQNLLYACSLNLTEYRIQIQGPVLNKDLDALANQVDTVARQLRDRVTARSLQGISGTMRDLSTKMVKPLMKLQDDLVYKLAVLELQVQPLQRQVNQSISHLKTIQYYIDNQGGKIAQLKTKVYVDRLSGYLDQWRKYVMSELGAGLAKCKPLWDILEGVRLLFCSHILGNLDGFWFATLVCLIVMVAGTPMAHILSLVYKKAPDMSKVTTLLPSRSESPDTVIIDRDTWQTPEPPPPQEGAW